MSAIGINLAVSRRTGNTQITSFAAIQISPGSGHSRRCKWRPFATAGSDPVQPAVQQILGIPFDLNLSIPNYRANSRSNPLC